MRGKQGTGKGVFVSQFGKLFGQHFLHVKSSRLLTGNFNAHLKDALIVFSDEAFFAGDKQMAGVLKGLITEDTNTIEFKGKDAFQVNNYVRLLIASNNDWVIPAGMEERRFLMLDVSEAKMQNTAYFAEIIKQMDSGGREALLHHLMECDLDGVNLRKIPSTDALFEQKVRSMGSIEQWWYEKLVDGAIILDQEHWNDSINSNAAYEDYIKHAEKIGERRRASPTEFGITLKKLAPGVNKKLARVRGKRVYHYLLPNLIECRRAFEELMRMPITWPKRRRG